jgi:ABC-type sulfate transport system permease subunit
MRWHRLSSLWSFTGRHRLKACATGIITDARAQVTVEWALIAAAVAIPLLLIFRLCLVMLVAKYRLMTFMNSLPLP